MKIGVDARPLSYTKTGIGVYLEHLLDSLQSEDNHNRYYLISSAPIKYFLTNINWHKIEGRFKNKCLSTLWMQLFAPLYILKYRIDLFWSPRHHLPIFLPPKTVSIITVHDLVHRLYPQTMPLSHLLVERLFMYYSLKKANRIICVSRSTATALQHIYHIQPDKLSMIYHGIPRFPSDASPHIDLPDKYFLFVGTLEPRKNIEYIIKAFTAISYDHKNIHLVIVGDAGWKNKRIFKIMNQSSLKNRIHYKGFLPRKDLASIYSNAFCLLLPSIYEGFGFPILEAMSRGIPVITSNRSSMAEIGSNSAILVDPFDVFSLIKAMKEVLTNAYLRKSLIQSGQEKSKLFSWQNCTRKTLKAFYETSAN